jgi:hypothetical protein
MFEASDETKPPGKNLARRLCLGIGEVTRLIEPGKIDVLFQDRLRRLIHAQDH